ncbi:hypothetical protein [Brevundimonas subvibrioides]|uniref:hypothetical protein n=1 Tax=Brevundimonas subvibrioides TaxID=74313 RepID=UPI0032D5856D
MTSYPTDRRVVFVDGGNLYSAARALNADLDQTMLDSFRRPFRPIRACYDTAAIAGEAFLAMRRKGFRA